MLIEIAANPHVFISMPIEVLADAGIGPYDAIEIYAEEDKVVLKKAEPGDYTCDGDCESCPFADTDEAIVNSKGSRT